MSRLILRHEGGETEYRIHGVVTIGRQATNDITVLDKKASRHHARVMPSGRQFFVEDLGSSNGTLLNGTPVGRQPLRHGDVIRIGQARLMFYEDRASNLEGQTVGNYRIHQKIGQGGMGTVYRATQISMDRTVALKLLNDELTADEEFLESFLMEARTAAKLSHPNIVRVHDFGEAAGTYYFSMEFVEGEGLDAILKREGKLPVRRSLEIAGQVARALDHAHSQNVIHRDIKPQNILIALDGTAKLTDLGLARVAGLEASGAVIGTPDYMPPEIAQQRSVDSRADIYQLGATLFHMVTGRLPYEGPDAVAIIAMHIRDPIPSPRQYDAAIPDSLCRLIETTMSKNPAMRPSPASLLVDRIDDVLKKDADTMERPPRPPAATLPPSSKSGRAPRRRVLRVAGGSPITYALIGALVVAILGVTAFVMTSSRGQSRPTQGTRTPTGRRRSARSSRARPRGDAAAPDVPDGLDPLDDGTAPDPETAAMAERRAAERLAEIRRQIADNPATKTYAGRMLYRLVNDYPHTKAADEARELYREFVGRKYSDDVAPGVNRADPGGLDQAPAGPIDEGQAQETFNKVRIASLKAEADADFDTARQVLVTFISRYRGSRREPEARELLERLDARIERELGRLRERAEAATERGDLREAEGLLKEIVAKDPVGPDRERALKLLRSGESAAAATYEDAFARAASHFRAFAFEEAARTLRQAEPELAGSDYEQRLAAVMTAARNGPSLVDCCAEALAAKSTTPPVLERREESGETTRLRLLDASPTGLLVRGAGAKRTLPWADLTSDEIAEVFGLVPVRPADRLTLGAVLLSRGSWLQARRELERARTDPAVREQVEGLLAQVDVGMKTEVFDFSRFDQGLVWKTEGDSKWAVRGGVFVHEDSGVGSATLTTRTYGAVGFYVAFEVAFLEQIGALEVQLGSGDESVWFSLGSSGYEARSSAGGEEAKARGEWRMQPETRHKVKAVMTEKGLSISVDGRKLPALKTPGLDRIRGHLTFRAQGARLALDDVEIRQVR
jgi:serine/threonine protein kinase